MGDRACSPAATSPSGGLPPQIQGPVSPVPCRALAADQARAWDLAPNPASLTRSRRLSTRRSSVRVRHGHRSAHPAASAITADTCTLRADHTRSLNVIPPAAGSKPVTCGFRHPGDSLRRTGLAGPRPAPLLASRSWSCVLAPLGAVRTMLLQAPKREATVVRVSATEIAHEALDSWLARSRYMAAQEVPGAAGWCAAGPGVAPEGTRRAAVSRTPAADLARLKVQHLLGG